MTANSYTVSKGSGEGNSNPLQYFCLENSTAEEPGRLPSVGLHRIGYN